MNPNPRSFERFEQAVAIIAQHADFAGKQEVVAECIDDIEACWSQGLLTLEERFRLCATLVRGTASQRDRSRVTAV